MTSSAPYFVDLAPLGDLQLFPAAFVAALGVEVDPNDDVIEGVRSALSDHVIVLVIDNCEHLLPQVADLVNRLLVSSPGVRVVATSRQPLDVAGERVWSLDPLGVPPANGSSEEVQASESGALFIARLPINVTTRSLGAEDVAAVGMICRSLEGMPLALELAAARSRTLSLPDLADRLQDSISEVTLPAHGVLPGTARCVRPSTGATACCTGRSAGPAGDERVRWGLRPAGVHGRVCR